MWYVAEGGSAMSPKRSSLLVVCLVAVVALGGCAGQQLDEQQEEQIVERFEERMESVDGYSATVSTSATFNNQSVRTTSKVWARTGTGAFRQEIVAPESRAGSRTVSNGTVLWTYNAEANTATRVDVPETNSSTLLPQVGRLAERYDIYANGTVDLNGTEAYKLTLVPNASAELSMSGTLTMWVDTETLFPRKLSMDFAELSSTVRYSNVTLNPEFEPGTFEFTPPEGVEIREPSMPDVTEFDSYEALRSATSADVPPAELPGDFAFEQGSVIDMNGTGTVSVRYTNGTTSVTVAVSQRGGSTSDTGEPVTIGDRRGTYAEFGNRASLSWECGDTTYTAHGALDKATLVDIATAIEC